jgi:hypothetical protein
LPAGDKIVVFSCRFSLLFTGHHAIFAKHAAAHSTSVLLLSSPCCAG